MNQSECHKKRHKKNDTWKNWSEQQQKRCGRAHMTWRLHHKIVCPPPFLPWCWCNDQVRSQLVRIVITIFKCISPSCSKPVAGTSNGEHHGFWNQSERTTPYQMWPLPFDWTDSEGQMFKRRDQSSLRAVLYKETQISAWMASNLVEWWWATTVSCTRRTVWTHRREEIVHSADISIHSDATSPKGCVWLKMAWL
jgi:hypothetical protein